MAHHILHHRRRKDHLGGRAGRESHQWECREDHLREAEVQGSRRRIKSFGLLSPPPHCIGHASVNYMHLKREGKESVKAEGHFWRRLGRLLARFTSEVVITCDNKD